MEEELRPDAEAAKIVTDEELINIEIKELNKRIKDKGVSKNLAIRLKQRRRTLKNRNYATSCREKKDAEIVTLEVERAKEMDDLRAMEQDNQKIREKVESMAKKYERIMEFARENNLEVNDAYLELIDR